MHTISLGGSALCTHQTAWASRSRVCQVNCLVSKPSKPRLSYVGVAHAAGRVSSEGVSLRKAGWMDQLGEPPKAPSLSRSDQEFLGMGLEFMEVHEGLQLVELNELFEKVGFPRRDNARLRVALDNTHRMVWVRSTKRSRLARLGQLIGFARATSDGVFSATVWDVAVNPAYQRVGLGRALMERLTRRLVEDGISAITLYAEPGVVGLYEKLGFVQDPEDIKGMAFQRRKGPNAGPPPVPVPLGQARPAVLRR